MPVSVGAEPSRVPIHPVVMKNRAVSLTGILDRQDEFEVGSVSVPSHLCDEVEMSFKYNGFQ
jgi:hypothetical protein